MTGESGIQHGPGQHPLPEVRQHAAALASSVESSMMGSVMQVFDECSLHHFVYTFGKPLEASKEKKGGTLVPEGVGAGS